MGITLTFNDRDEIPDLDIESMAWAPQHVIADPAAGPRKAQSSDVRLTRVMDRWSSFLATANANGTSLGTVTIVVSKHTTGSGTRYLTIVLTGVYVSFYQTSSGGDTPQESFGLDFDSMTTKVGQSDDS